MNKYARLHPYIGTVISLFKSESESEKSKKITFPLFQKKSFKTFFTSKIEKSEKRK